MLRVSKLTDYATVVMTCLAGAGDDVQSAQALAERAHLELPTVSKLLKQLAQAGLVVSARGINGGYRLARAPREITIADIVTDMNFDMPLPLWKLTSVYIPGETESTLGADARAVGADQGIAVVPDPLPDRNVFIRADQYSFVRQGVPSLFFKFGFAKGTPEFAIEHDWRANRYHAPSDDLDQPGIFKEDAVKLDAYTAAIALRVANTDKRPEWLPDSIFRKVAE